MKRVVTDATPVTVEELLAAARDYDRKRSEVVQVVNTVLWLIKESELPGKDFMWRGTHNKFGWTWQIALREEPISEPKKKQRLVTPARTKLHARCFGGNFLFFSTDPTWTANPSSSWDLRPLGIRSIAIAHRTLGELVADARRNFPKLSGEIEQLFMGVDGWETLV